MATRTVTLAFLGDSKQLQASMAEAGLTAQKTAGTIGDSADRMTSKFAGGFSKIGQSVQNFTGLPVAGFFDRFASKMDGAETKGKKFGATLSAVGGGVALGLGAALIGVGGESLHMADQFETAQAAMGTAIKNAGGNIKALTPQINAAYSSMAKFGFNSTDTASAMTTLTTATGNPTKAMGLLTTAANLARLKNISLSAASGMIAKAFAGSTRALTSMGLNLDIGSGKLAAISKASAAVTAAQTALGVVNDKISAGTLKGAAAATAMKAAEEKVSTAEKALNKDHAATGQILDAINKKAHGAADAYGHTLSGQMATARAEAHNLGTQFGQVLVPIIQKVISIGSKLMGFLLTHKPVLIGLAAVIGGVLLAAVVAWTASMVAAAAASIAAAAPILLVIAIVLALAAAVYEIVKHWGAISGWFAKLWDDVKRIFMKLVDDVVNIIKGWYPIILAVLSGGVLLLPALIFKYWSKISKDASKIIDAVVGFFKKLPGRIVTALGAIVSTIWGALKKSATWIDTNVLQPLIGYYMRLPGRIVAALGDIVGTIFAALRQAGSWIDQNVLQPVIFYFATLPGRVVSGLGNIVGTIFGALSGAWTWIYTNVYQPIVAGFTNLPNDIGNAIGSALGALGSIGKNIINAIIGGVDDGINFVNSHIPSILGVKVFPSIPDIPKLATGGIVKASPGGTIARLGEGGEDEFVIPRSRMGGGGKGGDTYVTNQYITVTNPDPQGVVNALVKFQQRGGSLSAAGIR